MSRWVSADPPLARGDYLPVPPVNDKAKERNSKLPGMGGVFNTINLDAYHYAGDNPVRFFDPDGDEVEATFFITRIEKNADGNGSTAYGKLIITDKDKKITIIVNVRSGGLPIGDPIPTGEYDILEQESNENYYRLEPKDSPYGNDKHDNSGRNRFRLHHRGSGRTFGCISVDNDEDWKKIKSMLDSTNKSDVEVDYQGSIPFKSKETIEKYGTLELMKEQILMKKKIKNKVIIILVILFLISLIYYLNLYIQHSRLFSIVEKLQNNNQTRSIEQINIDIKILEDALSKGNYENNLLHFIMLLSDKKNLSSLKLALDWLYYNQNRNVCPAEDILDVIYFISIENPENLFLVF